MGGNQVPNIVDHMCTIGEWEGEQSAPSNVVVLQSRRKEAEHQHLHKIVRIAPYGVLMNTNLSILTDQHTTLTIMQQRPSTPKHDPAFGFYASTLSTSYPFLHYHLSEIPLWILREYESLCCRLGEAFGVSG